MKILKWLLFNSLLSLFMYLGYYKGIEGAQNAALFLAWLTILLSTFLLSSHVRNSAKGERPCPAAVNVVLDLGFALAFAWYDAPITGAFLVVQLILVESFWLEVQKNRGKCNG